MLTFGPVPSRRLGRSLGINNIPPTLDSRLSETINNLRPLGIPIAIISNASLIWRKKVRKTLAMVDWVSLKLGGVLSVR